jgi:hypothetical protein
MKILLLSLLLVGCSSDLNPFYSIENPPNHISYYKDQRTHLCFAYYFDNFSYVPCTPEVEQLLTQSKIETK